MVPQFLIDFRDWISQPWPWYAAGPMLALIMFILLWFGHEFGISDNFRLMCAADGADEMNEFFKINWQAGEWNLLVALGAVFGGYIASHYLVGPDGDVAHISDSTIESLRQIGIQFDNGKMIHLA